jgi:hypothetical protein
MFGASPVAAYSGLRPQSALRPEDENVIGQIVGIGKERSPGNLVAITHWEEGAWSQVYKKRVRGLVIPKSLIKAEYDLRMRSVA